jgi:DDE superfamily endonuclease
MGEEEDLILVLHFQNTVYSAITSEINSPCTRNDSNFSQRLMWCDFTSRNNNRFDFVRLLRMPESSFNKLLSWIYEDLEVDNQMAALRGGCIIPQLRLFATLRYLAGGSYLDIIFETGISSTSFYSIVWETIGVLRRCPKLSITFPSTMDEIFAAAEGFQSISTNGAIMNCVGVVDGYHLEINTPPKKDARNVRNYFSGHYQSYGINVQAVCDHQCRFTYIGVAGPGNMGDRDAVNVNSLGKMIESLPGLFCVIGDCAYTPTEHLVPIYRGDDARISRIDNFNFYASQLRIRIEMAFGLMVKKWAILQKPLSIKMENIHRLVVAIAQLHNFCIDERLLEMSDDRAVFASRDAHFDENDTALRELSSQFQYDDMFAAFDIRWSQNRDLMAQRIEQYKWTRIGRKKRQ